MLGYVNPLKFSVPSRMTLATSRSDQRFSRYRAFKWPGGLKVACVQQQDIGTKLEAVAETGFSTQQFECDSCVITSYQHTKGSHLSLTSIGYQIVVSMGTNCSITATLYH